MGRVALAFVSPTERGSCVTEYRNWSPWVRLKGEASENSELPGKLTAPCLRIVKALLVSLDDRRAAVLRAVVEEYIDTAQPVGSSHVAHAPGLSVSSATIRNDMVALEHDGYLHQPHTSAGRIPTEKGYRFFVDRLLGPSALETVRAEQVKEFFDRAHGELEQTLADASELLTKLTDYTALVVGAPAEQATIRSAQIVALHGSTAMVVVVLSSGAVNKHVVELAVSMSDVAIAGASAKLSMMLTGQSLGSLGSIAIDASTDIGQLIQSCVEGLRSDLPESDAIFVSGASRMATSFDAVETVRQVLSIVEQQYVMVSMMRQVLDTGIAVHSIDMGSEMGVSIGSEIGLQPLLSCSVIVAPITVEGERAGSVGVLGPTRMNYSQAMAAVAVVSGRLGRRLAEG